MNGSGRSIIRQSFPLGCLVLVGLATLGLILQIEHENSVGKERNNQDRCASQMKVTATALLMYSRDYDNRLPLASQWNQSVSGRIPKPYGMCCPDVKGGQPSYAINSRLIGVDIANLKDQAHTIMLFECTPGANRVGGVEILSCRHADGCYVACADSHVKWLDEKKVRSWLGHEISMLSGRSHHTHDKKTKR